MRRHTQIFSVRSRSRIETIDISSEVVEAVRQSGVAEGIVCVSTPHTTAAIYVNENERGLRQDVVVALAQRLLDAGGSYEHNRVDSNAQAHLAAILVGNAVLLPVSGGHPELGTWQSIFFLELDGPRTRTVSVKVVASGGNAPASGVA